MVEIIIVIIIIIVKVFIMLIAKINYSLAFKYWFSCVEIKEERDRKAY